MKRCKIKLQDILEPLTIFRGHDRAQKNKKGRHDVIRYNLNKVANNITIYLTLRACLYWPSRYHDFYIYDPKLRLVQALTFSDRVVHQFVVEEIIKPYYLPRFIKDSYACIKGRGTHAAVMRLMQMASQAMWEWGHDQVKALGDHRYEFIEATTPYVVKMDISKFFPNIDRDILFAILKRDYADPAIHELFRRIIFDPGVVSGIPIGNYTSQFFANIYLNELDHYVKEVLRCKYYVRYMDDFIVICPTKEEAQRVFALITKFVNERLNLPMNPKSGIMPLAKGVNFCGYRIYPYYLRLSKRQKRSLRRILHDYESGRDSWERFKQRVISWLGFARWADKDDVYARKVLAKYWERLTGEIEF